MSPAEHAKRVEGFWNRYRNALARQGIRGKRAEWTVKRAQHFVEAVPALRLADRTPEDLRAYFANVFGRWPLKDWQVGQLVDAVRILYQDLLQVSWAADFPWKDWKEPHLNFPDHLERYGGRGGPRHVTAPRRPVADSSQGLKAVDRYPELFERLRTQLRTRQYSLHTERAYESWLHRFVTFPKGLPPRERAEEAVRAYLGYLVRDRQVSASTQNQALCTLVFAYREALGQPPDVISEFGKAKRPRNLPTVLSHPEVERLLDQ